MATIEMSDTPSAWRIEQALAAWMSARSRLLEDDSTLERDEAALTELLGPAEGDIESILARLLRAARHAESMASAAKSTIQDMQARKTRYETRAASARQTIFAIMEALDRTRIELPDITASIRTGQQSVIITDEEKVPDIYVRIERIPDKQTILSALKSGLTVDGCTLSNGLKSLSLRTK